MHKAYSTHNCHPVVSWIHIKESTSQADSSYLKWWITHKNKKPKNTTVASVPVWLEWHTCSHFNLLYTTLMCCTWALHCSITLGAYFLPYSCFKHQKIHKLDSTLKLCNTGTYVHNDSIINVIIYVHTLLICYFDTNGT